MSKILNLASMLREKKISCVELTEKYLSAARRINPKLNAYISITEDIALKSAAEADKKFSTSDDLPPLLGIPFVLKDNIATSGLKTTCASKMLENHVPIYDAAVWEALKEQGAVLMGKGNMDEMGMGSTGRTSYFGQSLNPIDTSSVPGGSSGGVAAAIASGTAIYGIGSDTGGSIRQPASLCGLVGLKPTYGAVSRYGLFAFSSSLDQLGPIATSALDAAIVFDAISTRDKRDMTSIGSKPISQLLTGNIKGMRIGIIREFFENIDSDISKSVQNALSLFEEMGAVLVDLSFPLLNQGLSVYQILSCAEAASNLGRFDGIRYGYRTQKYNDIEDLICKTRSEGFGTEVKRRIMVGTYVLSAQHYDMYYLKALKLQNAIKNEYKRIFKECDCLVTPTLNTTKIKIGENRGVEEYKDDINNVTANIAGLPAVSLPCGFDGDGLPIGMQIIGNKFCEDIILNTAFAFETKTAGAYNIKMPDDEQNAEVKL